MGGSSWEFWLVCRAQEPSELTLAEQRWLGFVLLGFMWSVGQGQEAPTPGTVRTPLEQAPPKPPRVLFPTRKSHHPLLLRYPPGAQRSGLSDSLSRATRSSRQKSCSRSSHLLEGRSSLYWGYTASPTSWRATITNTALPSLRWRCLRRRSATARWSWRSSRAAWPSSSSKATLATRASFCRGSSTTYAPVRSSVATPSIGRSCCSTICLD